MDMKNMDFYEMLRVALPLTVFHKNIFSQIQKYF